MQLLVDECCDRFLVEGLRKEGHDILWIREVSRGLDDEAILRLAADLRRIILTEDKDFGELVVRLALPSYGVILLRFAQPDWELKLRRLQLVLLNQEEQLPGHLTIIEETRSRLRPLQATIPTDSTGSP